MTEYEDQTTDKNEQELNLFSEQVRPEDAPTAPETDVSSTPPAGAPEAAPAQDEVAIPPTSEPEKTAPASGDSPVVAPPPPRKQPAVQRPGIVSPRPGRVASSPASAPPQKAHKPLPHALQQNQTLGQMLTFIRTARGLSIEDVSFSTHIRQEYLAELEADELLKALPRVYVSAYVRKLIAVYDLSRADSELLLDKMHEDKSLEAEEIPEKLVESVNDGVMVNEGENKRIRNITIVFFSVIGIVALAILWLVVLVIVRYARTSDPVPGRTPAADNSGAVQPAEEPVSQTIHMDESELDALIVPETPSISILKMSKVPGVRDTP